MNKINNNVYDFATPDCEENPVVYHHDSDEETEDASETESELMELMYQDKLASLKRKLQQLHEGTNPEYLKRSKKLEQSYKKRLSLNQISRTNEIEIVQRQFISDKKTAAKDFEEKKVELKENLIAGLESKKKSIENELSTVLLTGVPMEVKPVTTMNLRRTNVPIPEKRHKTSPPQLNYLLEESEILEDLKILNMSKSITVKEPSLSVPTKVTETIIEVQIDDGKL